MVTASRLMGLKKRLFSPRNDGYPLQISMFVANPDTVKPRKSP